MLQNLTTDKFGSTRKSELGLFSKITFWLWPSSSMLLKKHLKQQRNKTNKQMLMISDNQR